MAHPLLMWLAAAGCGGVADADPQLWVAPDAGSLGSLVGRYHVRSLPVVDLLLVVDNSPGMGDQQELLGEAIGRLV